ncbi:IclR family transcriptional regulator [Embleya sp. NBC_00896]|uniref:IclR family transcriptional regulator n=1 Tax=Embleya sp. NBC_00896 TaxID=2975961 RepID=UPI003870134E|nr:helix-turn-helix domain-containing protein [Embleya sp. NBC_00896]
MTLRQPSRPAVDRGAPSASPPTDRVIAVLGLLAANPGREFTLADVIRETGISKATCHAVVRRLVDAHYLLHTPSGYTLGPALIAVGHAAERSFPAVRAAHRHLASLAEEFGVPCTAAVHDTEAITIVDAAGPHPHSDTSRIGRHIPLIPPYGAVQIAWSGEDEIRAWLDRAPRADDDFRRELVGVLRTIRRRGYDVHRESTASIRLREALSALENEDLSGPQREAVGLLYTELSRVDFLPERLDDTRRYNVNVISAPAFDAHGRTSVVLALLMAKPLRGADITRAGERLLAATAEITRSTGGRHSGPS